LKQNIQTSLQCLALKNLDRVPLGYVDPWLCQPMNMLPENYFIRGQKAMSALARNHSY